ncbi:MAG: WD40 repeat domain-containing protein [Desulfovibrionaceae bacterium]
MEKGRDLFVLALLLPLLLVGGGCAARPEVPPDPDLNLARFLDAARSAQAFPLAGLYAPPPADRRAGRMQLVAESPVVLDLARAVTAFAAWDRGLAVGHADGSLDVIGPDGCRVGEPRAEAGDSDDNADAAGPPADAARAAMAADDRNATAPDVAPDAAPAAAPGFTPLDGHAAGGGHGLPVLDGPIRALAYSPDSPWILAVDGQGRAHRLDVADCELVETYDLGREVRAAALSQGGETFALLDAAGTLWTGRPGSRPKPALEHAGPCIGLGFTPAGAVLALVHADGSVLLYNAAAGTEMERLNAPGGPFAAARVDERYLALTRTDGSPAAYDLAARQPVPFTRRLAQYALDPDGVLRYRTWNPVLHRTDLILNHPGPTGLPNPRVEHSAALGLLRVTDIDGVTRYYAADTGLPQPCATALDWRPVRLDDLTRFRIDGRDYTLADTAFQWDHDQLLCRWIPEAGYYLWWRTSERPREYSPLPDHLPRRTSLRTTVAPTWWPLAQPPDFP